MTTRTVQEASSDFYHGFYVPRFEIRIEGAGLPDGVLRDVIEVKYKDNINELDSFQLTVNNWDEAANRFKFIGSETPQLLAQDGPQSRLYKLFEPCDKVAQISMGYGSTLEPMITGTFTTMEPEFSPGAASTLNVRGLNVLHQLRRKKYDDQFHQKKESQIATQISQRRDRQLRANRFPLTIRTDPAAEAREVPIFLVSQKQEYDIDFLWKRARSVGYVVTIEEETDEHPRQLYFGPSSGGDSRVNYQLEWRKSLVQLSPRLTTANQFKSVTVNGWNRGRQRPISVTVDFNDRELRRLNPDLHEMIERCDPREELVVDRPVFSEDQARQAARALLLDQHKQMVKVNGTSVGLPELRAGTMVHISGIGSRLSGDFFVEQSEHTINDSGYQTKFQARREDIPEGNG